MAFASAGARVKAGSLHVSDSAVARVLNELNYLRSNHSDVMEAETDARGAFDSALKNHEKLKVQIDEKKAANDNYQKQVEDLLAQKLSLQANLSAAGEPQKQRKATSWLRIWKSTKNLFFFSLSLSPEDPCLICPSGWIAYNSSCYFYSSTESRVKKNWHDSRTDCTSRNADLIVVDNPDEQVCLIKKTEFERSKLSSFSFRFSRNLWASQSRTCPLVPVTTRSGSAWATQRPRASGFGSMMSLKWRTGESFAKLHASFY